MKKNLKSCVELQTVGEPQILLDMNDYALIEASGLTPDLKHKREAHMTAGWSFEKAVRARFPLAESDLSSTRFVTFSVFSVKGAGGSFAVTFESGSESGYTATLPVCHDGWNDYRLELAFLQAVGEPTGWDHVTAVLFDCAVGGQANEKATTLYLDTLTLWEENAPKTYVKAQELKGAAAFSMLGNYAIVDRKRVRIGTLASPEAMPFETSDGKLWLPIAPIVASLCRNANEDPTATTLSFRYRRKLHTYSGLSETATVAGEKISLGFRPVVRGGTLFFPIDYIQTFFHWRQIFRTPSGLILLSNRKNPYGAAEEPNLWALQSELHLEQPTGRTVMEDLHRRIPNPDRCRLLASYDEWMTLRKRAKTEGTEKDFVKALKACYGSTAETFRAQPILANPAQTPAERLTQYRKTEDLLIAWSALFKLTGDNKYARRVYEEMTALCELSSWDDERVLPASVAGFAMAIGYDWCHTAWSEGEKSKVERAMRRMALLPLLEAYRGKKKMWRSGSAVASQVNASAVALSLALSDIYPESARLLIENALNNLPASFASYAPDGGYAEGIEAWEKSTKALVWVLAMLENATGKTYGFKLLPGFSKTALFALYASTPNGAWNYHNSTDRPIDTATFSWFAKAYGVKAVANARQKALANGAQADLFDLLFNLPVTKDELPLDAVYRRAGLSMLRSSWGENAMFLGIHGGSNHEIGGELDAGSVIMECNGERFFVETGGREELPILLRRRAEGQNTVTVNPTEGSGADQNPSAVATFTEVRSSKEKAYAVVDLTSTNDALVRAKRGILLTCDRSVAVIQDELTLAEPGKVVWSAYTDATVEKSGARRVVLSKNGVQMIARLSGLTARFAVEPVASSNLVRLTVRADVKEKLRMAVTCTAYHEGDEAKENPYVIRPMSTWAD